MSERSPGRLEDYKPVKQRIHQMRLDHPDWTIETTLNLTDGYWHATTRIRDGKRLVANGHAVEKAHQAFDAEKAETSAVGRALVFAGYTDSLALSKEEESWASQATTFKETPRIETSHVSPPPVEQWDDNPQPQVEDTVTPRRSLLYLIDNPPVDTAPKGIWQDHVAAMVEAAKTDYNYGVDWRALAGKPFDKLTTLELKQLVKRASQLMQPSDLIDAVT